MHSRLTVLLLAAFTLVFSSCSKDSPIPAHTKAWLHDADGDVLTFRNPTTGATETLRAQVENTTHTYGGGKSFFRETLEVTKLTYAGQTDPNAGLRLEFTGDGEFAIRPLSEWDQTDVTVITGKKEGQEHVLTDAHASALLDDNVQLEQRTHAWVVTGRYNFLPLLPTTPASPNTLERFWYSKEDGLAAYTKTDGQTWYRVW